MRAAEELSYRPDQRARMLGRGRSRSIGISFGLHDENHGELVEAFYQASHQSGYDLILSPNAPTRSEKDAAESLLDYRCEALVLIGPSLTRAELGALASRAPVIVIARAVRDTPVDVVRTDDAAGARLAVDHLVAARPSSNRPCPCGTHRRCRRTARRLPRRDARRRARLRRRADRRRPVRGRRMGGRRPTARGRHGDGGVHVQRPVLGRFDRPTATTVACAYPKMCRSSVSTTRGWRARHRWP